MISTYISPNQISNADKNEKRNIIIYIHGKIRSKGTFIYYVIQICSFLKELPPAQYDVRFLDDACSPTYFTVTTNNLLTQLSTIASSQPTTALG